MKLHFLLTIACSFLLFSASAQQKSKKTETIEIKTSAVCGMCKNTIETALHKVSGVKSANLDVASKVVTVTYKPSATTPEEIRTAITKVGYDADDVPADAKAYENLHFCCKKGAH